MKLLSDSSVSFINQVNKYKYLMVDNKMIVKDRWLLLTAVGLTFLLKLITTTFKSLKKSDKSNHLLLSQWMSLDTVLSLWTEIFASKVLPNKLPSHMFWNEKMFLSVSKKACLTFKVLIKWDKKWFYTNFCKKFKRKL